VGEMRVVCKILVGNLKIRDYLRKLGVGLKINVVYIYIYIYIYKLFKNIAKYMLSNNCFNN
jgi:hypothetical protein